MASFQISNGSVLLLDALHAKTGRLYQSPREVISCDSLDGVRQALQRVDKARAAGAHLAGFLAYELGFAFETKLEQLHVPNGEPLLWFGVYDRYQTVTLQEVQAALADHNKHKKAEIGTPVFDTGRSGYNRAFSRVQQHLAEGDIYQVNFTMRADMELHGTPEQVFLDLVDRQPVPYAAFIRLDGRSILSLSPELFLQRCGQTIKTKPMKGTAPRGRSSAEDTQVANELARDPKQRAENTMIVDLMRNDLSRIAEAGSVEVTKLCEVERYKSLHQMTSTVIASLRPEMGFPEIIEHLFPCGSITGAPKLSAMTIAQKLEGSPRGVYTGSIGYIEPSGDFQFNVAIRTLDLLDGGTARAGTGSGVVYDSGAGPEYDECALKLKFLKAEEPEFSLFETMAYTPQDGFVLLDRHLSRLERSADYFGFSFDHDEARRLLLETVGGSSKRLRLDLRPGGEMTLKVSDLPVSSDSQVWSVGLAEERTCSQDRFLFHKTSNRAFYDTTRKRYADLYGFSEVIFENVDGFLTEGSYTNLFVRKAGRLLTPALTHGLLPGTFREGLLEHNLAYEADLTLSDLKAADEVFVGNSVRGLIRVRIAAPALLKKAS
ncbi:para-aminobenzoate synthetase/4-amino-4-deoxychorismate lyase [Roseibium hamelinense]|uniref:Probable branched-chain-amino-acid aminotransferase n=1 Tax=Roseibium hamelinense TaxID=150831 RepID=A0A562SHG1_9HYPH|nr:aminodeoxychorismate synthase component I [Roseibium hamelinense]MTI42496.1 aminodeoxychorismate synthase component I [Roseibium hamelinense]TWI80705.1 para-aminobenzoate synthetase/4-amino-4-deoxychorismate lyase [Roseibium hamelinense]